MIWLGLCGFCVGLHGVSQFCVWLGFFGSLCAQLQVFWLRLWQWVLSQQPLSQGPLWLEPLWQGQLVLVPR